MEKKKLEYLTISEVSKFKNVSIKSLRYYDSIGVLKPAYKNPETGYRYYLYEQLPMLNIISFCIEVGISLKNWNQYINEENQFLYEKLLADAKVLAIEKLNYIQTGLGHIERTLNKMNEFNLNLCDKYPYTKIIPARNLLFVYVDHAPTPKDFLIYQKQLFTIINELKLDVTTYYPGGILMDYTPEERKYYVFIEIDDSLPSHPNYRYIRGGTFFCHQFSRSRIRYSKMINPEYFSGHPSGTIIESDLINHTLQYSDPILELQYSMD